MNLCVFCVSCPKKNGKCLCIDLMICAVPHNHHNKKDDTRSKKKWESEKEKNTGSPLNTSGSSHIRFITNWLEYWFMIASIFLVAEALCTFFYIPYQNIAEWRLFDIICFVLYHRFCVFFLVFCVEFLFCFTICNICLFVEILLCLNIDSICMTDILSILHFYHSLRFTQIVYIFLCDSPCDSLWKLNNLVYFTNQSNKDWDNTLNS